MFDGVVLGSYTPGALLGITILLVLFGGLVPRWIHIQRIKDKDELIDSLKKALDKRDDQFERLFSSSELTIKLLEDLKAQAVVQEARHLQ